MTYFSFMYSEVYECTEGEHKGEFFIHFDRTSQRKVENGKVNRYPYYQISHENLKGTGYEIENSTFNDQIKIDYKQLAKGKDKNKVREALVIAYRIINYEKNRDQFSITLYEGWGNVNEHDEIKLYDTSFGGMERTIATITIDYVTGKIYVIHDKLHEKKNKYGHRITDHFDNKYFGFEYKKDIDFSELHLLNEKVSNKGE